MISWYRTTFGEEEIEGLKYAIRNEHISQGEITATLEKKLTEKLGVPYAVLTTSGSTALLMSMMAIGIKNGDEVIVPNRTWIATAHEPMLLNAKVKIVDVLKDVPLMDVSQVEREITEKTKAVIPVHLNGRSVDMDKLNKIAKDHGFYIIEDACQALFSKNLGRYLGTKSDIGCFSLGVTKIISTGQGGIAVTSNSDLYEKLKLIRNHGTTSVLIPNYTMLGSNFKFTDLQASIGIAQFSKAEERIEHVKKIYEKYDEAIKELPFLQTIPVRVSEGEVPIYMEVLCEDRKSLVGFLNSNGINTRLFLPDVTSASYIENSKRFPNSEVFAERGLFLPCGPTQSFENVYYVIQSLRNYKKFKNEKRN